MAAKSLQASNHSTPFHCSPGVPLRRQALGQKTKKRVCLWMTVNSDVIHNPVAPLDRRFIKAAGNALIRLNILVLKIQRQR